MKGLSGICKHNNKLRVIINSLSNTFRFFIRRSKETENNDSAEADEIVLSDNRNNTLFTVLPHNLICVAADTNYVDIFYIGKSGFVEHQFFRLTLKKTVEMCRPHLIQCHRSYFVNPKHIVHFNNDSNNLYLRIYKPEQISIPVSVKHRDNVKRIYEFYHSETVASY